jgi:hypothetical protein
MCPAQDEEFGMTADECDQEGDGSLMLLSASSERPKNTISARRKMWGEDGNGARRIKLR